MAASVWFCPGCGRPRTWLREQLQQEAQRTGVPYLTLLAQARDEAAGARDLSHQLELVRDEVRALAERIERLESRAGISAAPAPAEPASPEAVSLAKEELLPRVEPDLPVAEPLAAAPAIPAVPMLPEIPPAPEAGAWPATEEHAGAPTRPSRTLPDVEEVLSGRVLAWTGGLALLLGAVFFLSLAFSRGWIGPTARVSIGLVAGAVSVAGGGWFFERRERLFGHVLLAVGLGVLDMALLAGTRLYDLFAVELGLLGTLLSAVAAAAIAVRADSQVVAGYGLTAALVAPPLLGASPNGATIAFVAAVLVGTTGIALYRYWRWLPPLAFLLSAPQLADWVTSDPPVGPALVAVAGFWTLHALAAGGEEFRVRRSLLRSTSATLLLANAAYVVWAGFTLLSGDLDEWRGTFLAGVAFAHLALSGWFLWSEGDAHPFGMLAFGTGLAALSIAVPVQFGGPVVPIAWAAEAAALAWVYTRLGNRYSAGAGLLLAAGAVGHLLAFEYPLAALADERDTRYPFLNAEGLTLAFLLGAAVVAGWFLRGRMVRALLATAGLLLVIYALPFELSGVALVGAWSAVYVAAVGAPRLPFLRERGEGAAGSLYPTLRGRETLVPAALAATAAIGHVLGIDAPLDQVGSAVQPAWPFVDGRTLAVAFLAVAALLAGALVANRWVLRGSGVAAAGFIAYLMPFELEADWTVVAWAVVAAGAYGVAAWDRRGFTLYVAAAGALVGAGALVVLDRIATVEQLTGELAQPIHTPFWSEPTLAVGALVGALLAGFLLHRAHPIAPYLAAAAAGFAAYLMPFELGDATVVVAWSAITLLLGALARRQPAGREIYLAAAGAVFALGLLKTLIVVAPPERLAVDAVSAVDHPLLWSGATLALTALIAPLAVAYWWNRGRPRVRWLAVGAGALAVYLLSVGLVDEFQRRVGGETALEELQKQAQAALSILWAVLGGAVFVGGIARRVAAGRLFGLALLGLATAKVFIVDLASLDAAYRVLSFIGLGLLLLASSWAYQHWMPRAGGGDPSE